MISISKFTERELQQQDIHTLRELARSIGVSSPTSKKKSELIEQMLSIITGEKLPEYKNINRGRPAKKPVNYAQGGYVFGLGQKAASSFEQYDANKIENGVVSFENGTYLIKKLKFVSFPTDFAISEKVVKQYKLKDNDLVEYKKDGDNVEIKKVNNKPVKLQNLSPLAFGIQESNKNIKFATNFEQIKDIVEKLSKEKHVVLLPMLGYESANPNVTVLPTSINADDQILNNFLMSISIAQFYQTNQSVVFVAENFANVLSACKMANIQLVGGLISQISAHLSTFVETGGTFVGIVPAALERDILPMLSGYNICK